MLESLRSRQPGAPIWRVLWWHLLHAICFVWVGPCYRYRAWGVHNIPRHGRIMLVSNHQSFLDPILVGLAAHHRQFYALARSSLFGFPGFRELIRSLNAIPVERGEADMSAMRSCIDVLKVGQALLVFPEGTRTPDGTTQPFAAGTMLLIKRGLIPPRSASTSEETAGSEQALAGAVVPVAVEGAFEAWSRHRKLPRPTGRIGVMYGQPIPADVLIAMGPQVGLEHLRQKVESMRLELRQLLRQSPPPPRVHGALQ